MKINEVIEELLKVRAKHGDVPVYFLSGDGNKEISVGGYYTTATTTEGNKPFAGITATGDREGY